MGALRQPTRVSEPVRTGRPVPPAADPPSVLEDLRGRTDFDADTGYAPLYHAVLADLPRLSSGQVCTLFLLMVNMLSYGRPDKPKKGRHVWTLPVTVEHLAELCRCHVRDIQRQIRDLAKPSASNPEGRGLIDVKRNGRGAYSLCLLYRAWASLPDYVSGCKVVSIEEPEETAEDEPIEARSKEAVRLCKRPQTVRGGKTTRAIRVTEGVKDLCIQHTGAALTFDPVVIAGRLVIVTHSEGEDKANARRHGCRDGDAKPRHARADELIGLFDPLLQASGARLLMGDAVALDAACEALEGIPHDVLVHAVMAGRSPRGSRPISGPKVVRAIVAEAVTGWKAAAKRPAKPKAQPGGIVKSGAKSSFADDVKAEARRRIAKYGHL